MESSSRAAMEMAAARFAEGWMRARGLPASGPLTGEEQARFTGEALASYVSPGRDFDGMASEPGYRSLGGTAFAYAAEGAHGRTLYIASGYRPGRVLAGFRSFAERAAGRLPVLGMAGPRDTVVWTVCSVGPLAAEDREDLDRVREAGVAAYGSFETVAVSLRELMRREYGRPPFARAGLRFREPAIPDRSGRLYLGTVSLADLYRFMADYEAETGDIDLLYSENIRLEQGSSRINRKMRETLRDDPASFGLYNNGITVIADEAVPEGQDILVLRGASIINGCQTTRSVLAAFRDPRNPAFTPAGTLMPERAEWYGTARDDGFVMVKVVLAGGDEDELVYRVTKYANSQNAVGNGEMLGQNEFLSGLQEAFRSLAEPVFVETKQGGWTAEQQTQALLPERFRTRYEGMVTGKDLLKAAAAVHLRKPGLAAAGVSRFVPGESQGKHALAMAELSVGDYHAAYRVLEALDGTGVAFAGPRAGAWAQTRWLSCFLFAEALRHLAAAAGREAGSADLLAVLGGESSSLLTGLVAGELGRLYAGYLLQGEEEGNFRDDSGSSDRGSFLKGLDGASLPGGLARRWQGVLDRLAAEGSEALRLVREVPR